MADEPNKLRAEIRARQAEDGKKAMAEYEASAAATRVKTEKLRALRLAKEAAERRAKPPQAKAKAKPRQDQEEGPDGKLRMARGPGRQRAQHLRTSASPRRHGQSIARQNSAHQISTG